jgi:hypothetical protein
MKPSLVVGFMFLTIASIALAGPGGVEGADGAASGEAESAGKSRLHVLLTETETGIRVSPAGPDAKPKKGQYRVSCESFTFEWRGERPVLVFLDVVMESEEGCVEGTKAILHLDPPGWMSVEGTAFIKPIQAGWERVLQRQRESIERGMKASEWEHRQRWYNRLYGTKTLERENRPRWWNRLEGEKSRKP